jgi:hypothetical protein
MNPSRSDTRLKWGARRQSVGTLQFVGASHAAISCFHFLSYVLCMVELLDEKRAQREVVAFHLLTARRDTRDLRHPHHQPFDVVLLRDGNEPGHHPAHEMVAYRRQPVIIVLRHMRPCSLSWPAPGASTPSTRTGRKQTLEAVRRAAPRQQTTPEAGQRKSRN